LEDIIMKVSGFTSSVLIEFMGTTSNVIKELGEVSALLRRSESEGRVSKGHFDKELKVLDESLSDYQKAYKVLDREYSDRVKKSLGLKRSLTELSSYIRNIVNKNEVCFYTTEQYASYKGVQDAKKKVEAEKAVKVESKAKKLKVKK